jgi:hypothetical protein
MNRKAEKAAGQKSGSESKKRLSLRDGALATTEHRRVDYSLVRYAVRIQQVEATPSESDELTEGGVNGTRKTG